MLETAQELVDLQQLLDVSAQAAGLFLVETFEIPERTPSAGQLTAYLRGLVNVSVATVTKRCEPRVAPVTSLFVHGGFWIPTEAQSGRVLQLRANPAVSMTFAISNVSAIIAHGAAAIIDAAHPDFEAVDGLHNAAWWEPLRRERRAVYLRVDADRLFAWMGPEWPATDGST
jgi:general stress protein 26